MSDAVLLGIDVGRARIGVARSAGALALPVTSLARSPRSGPDSTDIKSIVRLVEEYGAAEVIVGLPLGLSGQDTASTSDAKDFGQQLAQALTIPVTFADERFSTAIAEQKLQKSGKSSKSMRKTIDAAAAAVILQDVLDSRIRGGEQ